MVEVHEFANDDIDDLDFTIKPDKSSDSADDAFKGAVREVIKGKLRNQIQDKFAQYLEWLKQTNADAQALAEDKQKRMQAEEEMKQAQEKSGDLKQQIFEE